MRRAAATLQIISVLNWAVKKRLDIFDLERNDVGGEQLSVT